MSSTAQGILVALINGAVICGVCVWSGRFAERTIYDRYIVRFESTSIPVRDREVARDFYSRVLNFTPLPAQHDTDKLIGFQLPEKRRLVLELRDATGTQPKAADESNTGLLVLRVRNGFEKLHEELVNRSGCTTQPVTPTNYLSNTKPGCISEIFEGERGWEFAVSDPDGNHLLFYRPKRFGF